LSGVATLLLIKDAFTVDVLCINEGAANLVEKLISSCFGGTLIGEAESYYLP